MLQKNTAELSLAASSRRSLGAEQMRRRRRAYASNLFGILLPALLAGGVAAVMYVDAAHKSEPALDLVTRADMIRNANTVSAPDVPVPGDPKA